MTVTVTLEEVEIEGDAEEETTTAFTALTLTLDAVVRAELLLVLVCEDDDVLVDEVEIKIEVLGLRELELLLDSFEDTGVEIVLLFAVDADDGVERVEDLRDEDVVLGVIVEVEESFGEDVVVGIEERVLLLLELTELELLGVEDDVEDNFEIEDVLDNDIVELVRLDEVALLVLELFDELNAVDFELDKPELDEMVEEVVLLLNVLDNTEELLLLLDVVFALDVLELATE